MGTTRNRALGELIGLGGSVSGRTTRTSGNWDTDWEPIVGEQGNFGIETFCRITVGELEGLGHSGAYRRKQKQEIWEYDGN